MKKIKINDIDYILYGTNEHTEISPYPHMAEEKSGQVPVGHQRQLLKEYLSAHGVTPIENATTHWCVQAAMKLEDNKGTTEKTPPLAVKEITPKMIPSERQYMPITIANIEEQEQLVRSSKNYGKEARIIHDVLNAFPQNTDLNTVAMKIAVIDVTNSTHLAQYKSQISLYDISKLIVDTKDFDARLEHGDPELVNIIARNNNAVNLFSLASKYCTYHNVEIYGRDDYSIFDGIVKEALPHYVDNLSSYRIDSWRTTYNYEAFNHCIGKLLDDYKIHIPFRRRKFDHFLWYANK